MTAFATFKRTTLKKIAVSRFRRAELPEADKVSVLDAPASPKRLIASQSWASWLQGGPWGYGAMGAVP